MSQELIHEFFRYTCIKKIISFSANYEYLNIVERWLLTAANDYQEGDMDRIIDPRKLKKSYFATEKMIEEFHRKDIDPTIADHVLYIMEDWTKSENHIKQLSIKLERNILCIKYNVREVFLYAFPEDLLRVLLSRGTLDQLGCVCLRYACILQQAQQWSNPSMFYDMLVKKYNASIEGFASPLNTRIILCSQTAKFCSLFPDVDEPFGSIGSFFDQDFVGKVVTVCPPYTVYIFDAILDKIKQQIKKAEEQQQPILFIFGLADWKDVPLLDFLESSEYVKYKFVTKRNEYSFVDAKADVVIPAVFSNRYYVLSVNTEVFARDFDQYFAENKKMTGRLMSLNRRITRIGRLDSRSFNGLFEAKQIIYFLRMTSKLDGLLKNFRDIPGYKILCNYLLADLLSTKGLYSIEGAKTYINNRINECIE